MIHHNFSILVAAAFLLSGCAATIPSELADARTAYQQASAGPSATLVPAELHKAHDALEAAEAAFKADPDGYHTLDLAYVAQRKAELAVALAATAAEASNAADARSQYQATQDTIMKDTRAQLGTAQSDLTAAQASATTSAAKLSASETAGAQTAAQLAASQTAGARSAAQLEASQTARAETAAQLEASETARVQAEARASKANDALAQLAAIKEESRGLVITLSGSVLFRSNEATLLPEARTRLSQVADALMMSQEHKLIVEGHTDSQGSDAHNLDLSQNRANAVRSFLIEKGYDPTRIRAIGIGEARAIADNGTAEGRANNRRVEIIVEPTPLGQLPGTGSPESGLARQTP